MDVIFPTLLVAALATAAATMSDHGVLVAF